MTSVLFVCLGNICRSPAGEGILKSIAEKKGIDITVASCGIGDWHIGELPDPRMQEAARARGVILAQRAQQFKRDFFDQFDYILAADHEILKDLHNIAQKPEHKSKIHLITEFSSCYKREEVPDPYLHAQAQFEQVLDMLEDACLGLIKQL